MHKIKIKISGKKGSSEKILSLWHFLVFAVIGVGITAGVYMFYSVDIDTRGLEANILYAHLSDCLINQGFVPDNFMKEDFDILKECRINKGVIDADFYFKVQMTDADKIALKTISEGKRSFEKDCEIVLSGVKAEKYPKCSLKNESVLYYENNQVKIATLNILTASNQNGKEISVAGA